MKINSIKVIAILILCLSIGAPIGTYARSKKKKAKTEAYKDGVWEGKGNGYMGAVVAKVTIKNGKIADVDIVSNDDTPSYMKRAQNGVIPAIVDKQSSNVDGVTGATYSSDGIKQAVGNALSKA